MKMLLRAMSASTEHERASFPVATVNKLAVMYCSSEDIHSRLKRRNRERHSLELEKDMLQKSASRVGHQIYILQYLHVS